MPTTGTSPGFAESMRHIMGMPMMSPAMTP